MSPTDVSVTNVTLKDVSQMPKVIQITSGVRMYQHGQPLLIARVSWRWVIAGVSTTSLASVVLFISILGFICATFLSNSETGRVVNT